MLPELPRTRETLLLRLLGAPATREPAEQEILRLAQEDPEGQALLRLAAALRLTVRRDKKIPAKQREDFMTEAKREVERMLKAGERRGVEKGMARTVLHVLKARGITVTQALRQRIVSCPDVRQLAALAKRAAVATSADDLFAST